MRFNIPRQFTSKDAIYWADSDIQDSQGNTLSPSEWQLTYHIRGAQSLDLSGTPNGDKWEFDQTIALSPGRYQAQIAVYKGVRRQTLGYVNLEVLPNLPDQPSPYDFRTENEKILATVRAAIVDALEEKAKGNKIQKYKIGDREMEYNDFDTLMRQLRELEKYYAWAVARERNRGDINQKIMRF